MKRLHVLALLFVLVASAAGYLWLNRNTYGDADILWTTLTQGGKGEGPELSYHISGRPLDAETEFFPAAKRLCKENAAATLPAAIKVMDKKQADFFQITFHYGKMFFHFARFIVENGKVNCDVLYDGQGTTHPDTVPEGT